MREVKCITTTLTTYWTICGPTGQALQARLGITEPFLDLGEQSRGPKRPRAVCSGRTLRYCGESDCITTNLTPDHCTGVVLVEILLCANLCIKALLYNCTFTSMRCQETMVIVGRVCPSLSWTIEPSMDLSQLL